MCPCVPRNGGVLRVCWGCLRNMEKVQTFLLAVTFDKNCIRPTSALDRF